MSPIRYGRLKSFELCSVHGFVPSACAKDSGHESALPTMSSRCSKCAPLLVSGVE